MSYANYLGAAGRPMFYPMSQILTEPVTRKTTTFAKNQILAVASSSMQGWRMSMEDRSVHLLPIPEDRNAYYCAVFDGHGGDEVAKYLERNLHRCIVKRSEYNSETELAIKRAFIDCDMQLKTYLSCDEIGSTANVVLIKNNRLYCANCGDSRAIACVGGRCVPLSFDHKPDNRIEQSRIVAAGGWVQANRVKGNLALSRAFGDFIFKGNSQKRSDQQMVISVPDVTVRTITDDLEFIIIACDGIWDCMTNEQAMLFCRKRIGDGVHISKICEELINHCISPVFPVLGTGGDNMTVIIIGLLNNKGIDDLTNRCSIRARDATGDALNRNIALYNMSRAKAGSSKTTL